MKYYRSNINDGMTVRSFDGKKLGKVYRLEDDQFYIEKGLFFPKDYAVRYEDIEDIRDGEIFLQERDLECDLADNARLSGSRASSERIDLNNMPTLNFDANRSCDTDRKNLAGAKLTSEEEMRVPLVEEELTVEKHPRSAGAVKVRKEVITEQKQVTVPVKHEQIIVERVPVTPGSPAAGEACATFDEKEIVMTAQDEEIEIHKRPVVREEVRVRKQVTEEQQTASTTVRREEAKVEDKTTKAARKAPVIKDDCAPPAPRRR